MKTFEQLTYIPESGIVVRPEGAVVRIFFDIEPAPTIPSLDGEESAQPGDLFKCYNVDVHGRTYGEIVSAIVNDKYSNDDVQAIIANYAEAVNPESDLDDEKRAEYISEHSDFQEWRKHAKHVASIVVEQLD